MSSSEATAPHNGTKTLSITIKRVCVYGCVCGLVKKGDTESEKDGGGVLNVLRGAKIQSGTRKPIGREWAQNFV